MTSIQTQSFSRIWYLKCIQCNIRILIVKALLDGSDGILWPRAEEKLIAVFVSC
jgi:hypothetical protein